MNTYSKNWVGDCQSAYGAFIKNGGARAGRKRGFEVVKANHRKNIASMPVPPIKLPQRGTKNSACYDIFSPIDIVIQPGERELIWTDVKVYMQSDEVLLLNVRSSQGKPKIRMANTQGIIDADYYNNESNDGNIGVYLENHGTEPYKIEVGDRLCQAMFTKYLVADYDEPVSEERKGGYGSTGK